MYFILIEFILTFSVTLCLSLIIFCYCRDKIMLQAAVDDSNKGVELVKKVGWEEDNDYRPAGKKRRKK